MCTKDCSFNAENDSNVESGGVNADHRANIFRFGVGGANTAPTTEYCTDACSADITGRDHWFFNSDGDKECSSDCAPPAIESIRHITGTGTDTNTLVYTNTDTAKQCIQDCSLHEESGVISNGYCRDTCETSAVASFRIFSQTLVPKVSTDPTDNFGTDEYTREEICAVTCAAANNDTHSNWFMYDHQTSGTGDDEKLCVQQCPPILSDLEEYHQIASANESSVSTTLALFKLMVEGDIECRRLCPNELYEKKIANGQANTFKCLTACGDTTGNEQFVTFDHTSGLDSAF
jgi:hypothetical protein